MSKSQGQQSLQYIQGSRINAQFEAPSVGAALFEERATLPWNIKFNSVDTLKLLLKQGVKPEIVNVDGKIEHIRTAEIDENCSTLLHKAAEVGDFELVKLIIIASGSHDYPEDFYGQTATDLAIENKHFHIAKFLREMLNLHHDMPVRIIAAEMSDFLKSEKEKKLSEQQSEAAQKVTSKIDTFPATCSEEDFIRRINDLSGDEVKNTEHYYGNQLVHIAAFYGFSKAFDLLLAKGANPMDLNYLGQNAFNIALESFEDIGRLDVVEAQLSGNMAAALTS